MCKIDLNEGWFLRYEELYLGPESFQIISNRENDWIAVDLPCDVHMPLIENGIIKEPLLADNCFSCEWIEDKSWWFKKVFDADKKLLQEDVVELILESLDVEADIFLNGFYLGHHKSAFYPFVKDIKDFVKLGENELIIRLTSGLEYFSELDIAPFKKYVGMEKNAKRGDERRIFVRKPQYVYGWDWGPRVASCGIMKNAYIKGYTKLAIRHVHVVTSKITNNNNNNNAKLKFEIEVENLHPYATIDAKLKIEIFFNEEKVIELTMDEYLKSGLNYINSKAEMENARIWWPNGMGDQPLYTVKVSAFSGEIQDEYPDFKIGIRTVQLITDKIADNITDKLNKSERLFAFEINGVRTFCKGANWIPADSIYARVADEKYEILIEEAKDANFNMLRIWGGGIYEKDIFYEKCDENGIMIWHDFMFACAVYPDNKDWFCKEVERELDYQTKRLRNHPSLVLWCGNNEIQWSFDKDWVGENKPPFLGGIICYNEIAPSIIRKNCPDIPYWNSSPYGGEHPNCSEEGDRHHWSDCMMNPEMEKRITPEEYDKITAKFISEYGYIGPPCKSTIIKYCDGNLPDADSNIWKLHCNTFEKETVLAGIAKHYVDTENLTLDDYLLYGGLCQGLMLSYSLEAIRFKKNCWGSLFWMYNDCWGEIGWSIIDYYLKRKISYYFVKRAFMPRKFILRENAGIISVMGINDTSETINVEIEYGYISFNGKQKDINSTVLKLRKYSRDIVLEFKKGDHDYDRGVIFISSKSAKDGMLPSILRTSDFRKFKIETASLKISDVYHESNDVKFTITTDKYAHAVHFNFGEDVRLSDEYFDMLPGEKREVVAYGTGKEIDVDDIIPKCVSV